MLRCHLPRLVPDTVHDALLGAGVGLIHVIIAGERFTPTEEVSLLGTSLLVVLRLDDFSIILLLDHELVL